MVNLLHVSEAMQYRWFDESEIRVPTDVFERFAKRNNFTIKKKQKNGRLKYKLSRIIIPVYYISGEEQTSFRFMDIADIHIGHINFDENALREKLQYALDNGISQVFIAGDIFEGANSEYEEMLFSNQIELAFSIFKDYPLTYFAINGNHDYSFEQAGFQNPIALLSARLNSIGIDFRFFDVYLMDFVICGVIKRMMHVERQDFNKKSIFPILKLKMFDDEGMLTNTYNNKTYNVRFFLTGHIHANVQMYYSKKKVFISQPGSFVDYGRFEERANIIVGRIVEDKVFMN